MEFCSVNPTKAQHLDADGEGKWSDHTREWETELGPVGWKALGYTVI